MISKENILFLQFEDLVLNIKNELKKVNNLLDFKENFISSKEKNIISIKSKKLLENMKNFPKVS